MGQQVRIDKWLWAVRIFKSRSLAADVCKAGKVMVNGQPAKPSRIIMIGDTIKIRKSPISYSYKVLGIISKRVSAKISVQHVQDITPPEEIELLKEMQKSVFFTRNRGTGRPTKKERRQIDKLLD